MPEEIIPGMEHQNNSGEEIVKFIGDPEQKLMLINYLKSIINRLQIEDRDGSLAEDVFQNTAVKLLSAKEERKLSSGILSIKAFIKISLKNGLWDVLRKKSLDTKKGAIFPVDNFDNITVEDALDFEPSFPLEEGVFLDYKLDAREIKNYLENEILPNLRTQINFERNMRIFELRTQDGLGFTEIAEKIFTDGEYNFTIPAEKEKAGDLIRQTYKRMLTRLKKHFLPKDA